MKLIPMETLQHSAECLRCISHPQRLRIIEVLLQKELNVNELCAICDFPQPVTSDHLRLMHSKGLLTSEKKGRSVYYKVKSQQLVGVIDCIKASEKSE